MKLSSAPALRYCCAPRPYWRLPTPVNGSKATSSRRSSTMAYRKPPSARPLCQTIRQTSPGFRWSVIAPTTPSKSPIRVTATVRRKRRSVSPLRFQMKDLIPALTRDKVYWLPITYYRSPLRLLMTWRSFSAQHNYHGVSNVESGISRRRQPTRATKIYSPRLTALAAGGLTLPFTLRRAAAAVQQATGDTTRIVWGACSVNCGSRCACGCTCVMMKWFTSKRITPATTATATIRSAPACAGVRFAGASIIRIALTIP